MRGPREWRGKTRCLKIPERCDTFGREEAIEILGTEAVHTLKTRTERGVNGGFDCFGLGSVVGLAHHRGEGAAARARRIPSLSMRACSVLRFNPSAVAAPFGPLITQSEAFSASRMCRRSASSMVSIFRPGAGAGSACRSLRGTFKIAPVDRITARSTRFLEFADISGPVVTD